MQAAPSGAHSAASTQSHSTFSTILRVTSGNFMEMYDFFLFGFYATYIAATFFPSDNVPMTGSQIKLEMPTHNVTIKLASADNFKTF